MPSTGCHSSQVSTASESDNEDSDDEEIRITIFDKCTDMPEYYDDMLLGEDEEDDDEAEFESEKEQ